MQQRTWEKSPEACARSLAWGGGLSPWPLMSEWSAPRLDFRELMGQNEDLWDFHGSPLESVLSPPPPPWQHQAQTVGLSPSLLSLTCHTQFLSGPWWSQGQHHPKCSPLSPPSWRPVSSSQILLTHPCCPPGWSGGFLLRPGSRPLSMFMGVSGTMTSTGK